MLESLTVSHFTVFGKEAKFTFSPGLNVILGENGAGKTHVLKLGYLFSRAWPDLANERLPVNREWVQTYFAKRLAELFQVNDLSALLRRGTKSGASLEAHTAWFVADQKIPMPWKVEIQRADHVKVPVFSTDAVFARKHNAVFPHQVLVPSKEMVSLFKGLIGLFDRYREFPLDISYRDLAVAMATLEPSDIPPLMSDVTQSMRSLLDGDLQLEKGELVFRRTDGSQLEISLMAEGYRKLAMLIYLLRYGVIERGSTLFWDEPESNLNPAVLKLLAKALHALANSGVQVVVATHSLFLLREFEVLQMRALRDKQQVLPCKYFGLGRQEKEKEKEKEKDGPVTVSQGEDIADIDPLVLLDENLLQSDRYMDAENGHARD